MSRIRLRVKEVAEDKGFTIMMLSRKSYVALGTLRAIFHDPYKSITTDTLQRIADALEVSAFDLMEEVLDDPADTEKPS